MHLCFICTPVLVADHALLVADCRQCGKWRPGDNLQQIWSKVRTCCDATCNRCRDVGPHICARRSLTNIVRGSLFSCSLFACLLHLKKRQDPIKARIPECTHQKGAYTMKASRSNVSSSAQLLICCHCHWWSTACDPCGIANLLISLTTRPQLHRRGGGGGGGVRDTLFQWEHTVQSSVC